MNRHFEVCILLKSYFKAASPGALLHNLTEKHEIILYAIDFKRTQVMLNYCCGGNLKFLLATEFICRGFNEVEGNPKTKVT